MFERPQIGNQALLVHIDISGAYLEEPSGQPHAEFIELARSAGAEVCGVVEGRRQKPDPKYFVGKGKADEIAETVLAGGIDLVVFNHALSPSQERNLERLLECRVLDRSGLILDIFAQRAQSFEGKLQVELAQLQHLSTRLVRGWSHLERQKGGIGLRGPGETQLETDRRLLGHRIKTLSARLTVIERQREQRRRSRRRNQLPTVALVGYTNAGKSTLFNALTGASTLAEDKLFATLDPTLRRLDLVGGMSIILADTVGFVRDLPHELVAAFRATLEETLQADLLLHIVDASDPHSKERMWEVGEVLAQIGADTIPQITVFNKLDIAPEIVSRVAYRDDSVAVSALTRRGFDELSDLLAEYFSGHMISQTIRVPLHLGRVRASLFEMKVVSKEHSDESGWLIDVVMPTKQLVSFYQREPEIKLLPEEAMACDMESSPINSSILDAANTA